MTPNAGLKFLHYIDGIYYGTENIVQQTQFTAHSDTQST